MVKCQFRDRDRSCKVAGIFFSTAEHSSIRQTSVVQVVNKQLYLKDTLQPVDFGPLDRKMGSSFVHELCSTCGCRTQNCPGHFGYVDLNLPVFHLGFFRLIIQVLQCICKNCCTVLLNTDEKALYRRRLAVPSMSYISMKRIHKAIVSRCKAVARCPYCNYINGKVKALSGQFMKIVHDRSKLRSLDQCSKDFLGHKDLESYGASTDVTLLNPAVVFGLFQRIPVTDLPFLVMDKHSGHPCNLIARRVPVPPATIRPSVMSVGGTNEDDLTVKISEITFLNQMLRRSQITGATAEKIVESWNYMQMLHALYVNSQVAGLPSQLQTRKFTRCLAQRLKGKDGRFRKNLSGKRVDFSGRTVISPDPNLQIFEVGVPLLVAKQLTFPERVSDLNLSRLQAAVINGPDVHPGAVYFVDRYTGAKKFLTYGSREKMARALKYGDVVERHMVDGDVVLFNRQPSLHKLSVMAHVVKVLPCRTFRFNECVCTPYNADFDGDEMNLHFPQTHEARAEIITLMNVMNNLVTPRNGEPLVAAIQDFITGAYLLTKRDTFLGKRELWKLAGALVSHPNGVRELDVPKPVILKPTVLWTGKQAFSLVIRPNKRSNVLLNMTAKCKSYTNHEEFCSKEGYVLVRNSQLLAGMVDKSLIGSGSKNSIFYMLMRDYGSQVAADAMWRLGRVISNMLMDRGFSISMGDVTPEQRLLDDKRQLVSSGYAKCDKFIEQLKMGTLPVQPGCSPEETLEAVILKELSVIRDYAGRACVAQLSRYNSPLVMAMSGSKGSVINISQMIACVGQQAISGQRPPDGFSERCLPHFRRYQRSPDAKGFVDASFYSGLSPHQFFFHAMAGREGLIDTAVKTAETGYMQRRLVKCLEDLCVHYDDTVRNAAGALVQFQFSGDRIDPTHVECQDVVVNLGHAWEHAINSLRVADQPAMNGEAIAGAVEAHLHTNKGLYAERFRNILKEFCLAKGSQADRVLGPGTCSAHRQSSMDARCEPCRTQTLGKQLLCKSCSIAPAQLDGFLRICSEKYRRAVVEPGTAVGAIAATSVGEPSTQMTLKTFHFAGVASMNITQGVPRIREVVNAVRYISTPVVTVALENETDENAARLIKGRIERTTLGEVTEYVDCVYSADSCYVLLRISKSRIQLLQLEVTMSSIVDRILAAKLLIRVQPKQVQIRSGGFISVEVEGTKTMSASGAMLYMRDALMDVVIHGLRTVNRCIIQADEKSGATMKLLVETNDFLHVLGVQGVDARRTVSNNPIETARTLGIEASRSCIISEIQSTMANHGIGLDVRHLMVLADMMTYSGEVTGMTRQGLPKIKDSVILQASFEKTTDHLYAAAYHGHEDPICGVSESIIMGTPISLGTGMVDVFYKARKSDVHFAQRPLYFEKFSFGKIG